MLSDAGPVNFCLPDLRRPPAAVPGLSRKTYAGLCYFWGHRGWIKSGTRQRRRFCDYGASRNLLKIRKYPRCLVSGKSGVKSGTHSSIGKPHHYLLARSIANLKYHQNEILSRRNDRICGTPDVNYCAEDGSAYRNLLLNRYTWGIPRNNVHQCLAIARFLCRSL